MEKEQGKIFVKDPNKTYGLMEIVDGISPMVEKAPEDTVDTFPHYLILLTICSLASDLYHCGACKFADSYCCVDR